MKLAAVFLGAVITLFLAFGSEAFANAQPRHATGEGTISVNGKVWSFDFAAHEGDLAEKGDWGSANIRTSAGRWLRVSFRCVVVSGSHAYMAGPVTKTNALKLRHKWVYSTVYDGGEPGIGSDQAGGVLTRRAIARRLCEQQAPEPLFTLTEGNIQVHE